MRSRALVVGLATARVAARLAGAARQGPAPRPVDGARRRLAWVVASRPGDTPDRA